MRATLFLVAVLAFAQDDLARGKKLYEGFCSLCHGQTGTGGKGPNLARPVLPRAANDEQLVEVIRQGIRGTEMPGFWQLTEREAKQLGAYVKSLGRIEPEKLTGNAAHGKELYDKHHCSNCHIVRGEGTGFGPELSEIGVRRSAAYLRESITSPTAAVPEGFLVVNLVTASGRTVQGMRVNEDSFSIQIRDMSGAYYSFRKSELTKIERAPKVSMMPPYAMSKTDLEDLIAYLASLRGES
jgi:putative heme-binding domain-containing protein